MKKHLLMALALTTASSAYAQLYITDEFADPSSVTNDGVVVLTQDQRSPFLIWNPFENTMNEIGGLSPGQGVGGRGRFTDDGKYIYGSMYSDKITVSTAWQNTTYSDLSEYIFKDIVYVNDYYIWAVGTTADGQKGTAIRTFNQGGNWMERCQNTTKGAESTLLGAGMECTTGIDCDRILIGGHNGKIFISSDSYSGFNEIDIHPSGDNTEVDTYWAMDFMGVSGKAGDTPIPGCVGLEATDGSYAVWYTADTGNTFHVAEGVSGVPAHITHVGEVFYMVTKNGHIQASVDFGKTWTDLFTTDNEAPLYRIRFADENKGIATADRVVYITTDGGETWTKTSVLPEPTPFNARSASGERWNDAAWVGDVITLVGDGGLAYQSVDNGATFTLLKMDQTSSADLTAMYYAPCGAYMVLANGLVAYQKAVVEDTSGVIVGRYDIENDTWTPLQGLGYDMDGVAAGSYDVSGDGQTVVGLIFNFNKITYKVQGYACAWNDGGGVVTLETAFDPYGKNTRANGVSYDGSKIVGWQEGVYGTWNGCYWTKQDDGSFKQTQMTVDGVSLEDVDFSNPDDYYTKLPGYCECISADGNWIGGGGAKNTGYLGPWIWNEEEGYTILGEDVGCVNDLSADGSVAVGRTGTVGWIWTKEDGLTYLNDYAADVLGCDMGDFFISSGYDLSPNGRYLIGSGTTGDSARGYMLDLLDKSSAIDTKTLTQIKASVYPNPVADNLHVALPYNADEVSTTLTLVDMQGRVVRHINNPSQDNVIPVNNLASGIYVLDVNAAGTHKTFKVMVKH